MMPLAIFDFDSTLFDTEFFKYKTYELAMVHGYSLEEAKEIYALARTDGDIIMIALDHYLDVLKERIAADERTYDHEAVIPILAQLAAHPGRLPGAAELVAAVTDAGFTKQLLTLGVRSWQEQKMLQGRFHEMFTDNEIIYTRNEKIGKIDIVRDFIEERGGDHALIMFNDKPTEMEAMLDEFENIVIFGRYEERDERYTSAQFEELEERYPDRFIWSDDLFQLKERFEELYG